MRQDRRAFIKLAAISAAIGTSDLARVAHAASADSGKLKIGVIGSGRVGGTLGSVWATAGHPVMFSSRDLEHDKALAAKVGPYARAGTPREAAAFGDVVLVAVPYRAMPDLSKELGNAISGKVVIDTSNPIVARDGNVAAAAREKGAGIASSEYLKGARIVRAFNAVSYTRMGQAHEEPGRVGMPIAGDDPQAIEIASRLIREIGFEPVLVGGLEMGRFLVPGTPLGGEHTPEEIRRIAATLK